MILDNTCITEADHEDWLAERRRSIGASEAATVLGLNPWDSPLRLYLMKTGALPPVEESPAMRLGKKMEPVIASLYQEETGCEFACFQRFVRSPAHAFITATLDCVRTDGRPVELKNVGASQAGRWGESGSDEVPPHTIIQAMQQMCCYGAEVIDVAALIAGQDFRRYTLERDERIIGRIIEANSEFWDRVERRDPPPIDPGRDGSLMAMLFPRAVGEIDLGPEGDSLVHDYEYYLGEIKERQELREKAKVELLALMKDAASARLGDGRILTRKLVEVGGRTIVRHPYSYVDLRLRKGD